MKDIKKKSVLIISENMDYLEKLKKSLSSAYSYTFFENNKFYLLNGSMNNFDLIIFDSNEENLKKFVEVFKLTRSFNFNIPVLLLEDEKLNDAILYKIMNIYSIIKKPFDDDFLVSMIDICFNFISSNQKIQFENGYHFDLTREELFLGKKIIKLTRTEKKLIKLLAENSNKLVTYEEISALVWKGKVFSIYSLRNVIKHIREKTDESFIKNSSNRGYVLISI